MTECKFTIDHYTDTLEQYSRAGYYITDFAEYFEMKGKGELPEKLLILRHDVDFSIVRECTIAIHEKQKSTFFVRLHSPFYNALDYQSISDMRYLTQVGGVKSIGIHIEPDMVRIAKIESPHQWLDAVVDIFDYVMPTRACAASLHCVAKGVVPTEWIVDALARRGIPLVTHDMPGLKYLSDSNGRWREGCFCQWIDKEPRIHLLTHPIWWFYESPQENY